MARPNERGNPGGPCRQDKEREPMLQDSKRTTICLALGLASLLTSYTVMAANGTARENDARKACLAGDVVKGVSILAELFVETMDPNYIFNQGRCFEQSGNHEQAIIRFREYLRTPNLSQSDIASANKHIAECTALLDKRTDAISPTQTTATRSAASIPSTLIPVSGKVPNTPAGIDLATRPASPVSPEVRDPLYKTWWFWTGTAAVVIAGTVTAILLTGRSSDPCDGASRICLEVP